MSLLTRGFGRQAVVAAALLFIWSSSAGGFEHRRIALQSVTAWVKICGRDKSARKNVCYTTRDFGVASSSKPVIAFAVYDIAGDGRRIFRIMMPVTLQSDRSVTFALDNGASAPGRVKLCVAVGCFAEARAGAAFLAAAEASARLHIAVRGRGDAIDFDVPLAGFAAAFEGAPQSPPRKRPLPPSSWRWAAR